jgi:ligand-binding sensor domain-containing protein
MWLLAGVAQLLTAQPAISQPPERLAQGQPPTRRFQHLTLREGLDANFATSIVQDKAGFIWVGTVNGVTRFDGLNCRTFTRQSGNPGSLSHRIVRSVFCDRKGTIWVGTQQNLNRFDPVSQTFKRYSFAALGPDCDLVRTIVETPDGQLWCGTKGGLVQFNPATGAAHRLQMPAGSSMDANTVRSLLLDNTTLWIGTQGGLFAYNLQTKQFRTFRHQEGIAASLPDDYVTALAKNPRTGKLVIGTNNGHVAVFHSATNVFEQLPLPLTQQGAICLLFTRNGDLWVGLSNGGLSYYESAKSNFVTYLNDELNPASIGSNSVKGLYEDRSGLIWITADDAGVSWFNPAVEKFHSLFDEIAYHPVSSLGLDAGKLAVGRRNCLWIATHDGLLWVDPQMKAHRLYQHDPKNPNSVADNHLYAVLADKQGLVWAGGPKGLSRFNPATNRFTRIPFIDNSTAAGDRLKNSRKYIAGEQAFTVMQHRDGRIFIGTNEKLNIYDPKTDLFIHQFSDERLRKLPGKNYNTLYFDRHDNIWVGGLGPVFKISPDLRLLATYEYQESNPASLPDEGVTGFAEDASGHMWLGTDNGLARLDERTGRFTTFTARHGLPSNDMSALLAQGDTLWASTNRGIARVNTRTLQLTTYNETAGLPSSEFESDAVVRDSTGRIYFGMMRGLVYVHPDQIRLNQYVPPVFITSFRVADQEFLRGDSLHPPAVVLDYTQNGFTFDMAVLNFDNPTNNRYAYRLEGFEEKWNQSGNRPFASYTNVPPDSYVLHVIGANNDGIWNREGYRLRLIINPPFWQTWWFRLTVLAILITTIVLVARWRVSRLVQEQREKSELRERIAASEMKALRSQMNPHFLYNSLNAIRLFVLQNDSDNADKYLVKFSRLMRLILDNSRQEWVSLASELEQLQLYLELEQLRFSYKFDFSISVDPTLSKDSTSIPPMIIQPYIENSILHGIAHKKNRGRIDLCLKPVGEGLECIIDDDGVGRQKAGELKSRTISSHKSVGLKVTEERLQLISQRTGKETSITVMDKVNDQHEPAGTKVVVLLPLL